MFWCTCCVHVVYMLFTCHVHYPYSPQVTPQQAQILKQRLLQKKSGGIQAATVMGAVNRGGQVALVKQQVKVRAGGVGQVVAL